MALVCKDDAGCGFVYAENADPGVRKLWGRGRNATDPIPRFGTGPAVAQEHELPGGRPPGSRVHRRRERSRRNGVLRYGTAIRRTERLNEPASSRAT